MDMRTILAHELANKVSTLKSVIELNIDCLDKELVALVDNIDLIARYMVDLEVLGMQVNFEVSRLKLRDIIEDILSELEALIHLKNINVKVNCDSKEIDTGEFILRRILYNLIHNAVKFSPEGNEVIVRCAKRGENLVISISNRVDRESKNRYKGSGIGLKISEKFAQRIGAKIETNIGEEEAEVNLILQGAKV